MTVSARVSLHVRGWWLAAVPLLALSWLLPASGVGLYLRLGLATLVVLLPGAIVARALRTPGVAGILAWTCAIAFAAFAVAFAVEGSLWLALGLHLGIGLAALPFAAGVAELPRPRASTLVLGLGLVFGMLLWKVSGLVDGDELFHLARTRKLVEFDELSLHAVNEFRDGGLHPGYAFPLWHGVLAMVARVADVDPALVVKHLASILAPLAFRVVYEAGVAVFRSASAGFAVLAGQVAITGLAAGHGGGYASLALPGTASRHLLVPATIALFFLLLREPGWRLLAALAAVTLGISFSHPTYTLFVLVPLAGFVVARALLARGEDLKAGVAGLLAVAIPFGAVSLWLLPIVRETVSHLPSAVEKQRALEKYVGQLDVASLTSYHLEPAVLARTGAVAVVALAAVPLALLAARRRWAAFVLGGSLAVLALMLVPFLFTHFSDLVSLSQSRRAAGFLPFAFAFAGAAVVLSRLLGPAVLPAAIAGGFLLHDLYPGDFGYRFGGDGGPAAVTWIAAVGGAAALLVAIALRRNIVRPSGGLAAVAAVLFVLPVAISGFGDWTPRAGEGTARLTPGLLHALRHTVPKGDIVWSEPQTSYAIAGHAPVYIAVAPPGHVADTERNRPYERHADAAAYRRSGDLAIPRRYGAQWIVTDAARKSPLPPLVAVYRDERYGLYRLPPG